MAKGEGTVRKILKEVTQVANDTWEERPVSMKEIRLYILENYTPPEGDERHSYTCDSLAKKLNNIHDQKIVYPNREADKRALFDAIKALNYEEIARLVQLIDTCQLREHVLKVSDDKNDDIKEIHKILKEVDFSIIGKDTTSMLNAYSLMVQVFSLVDTGNNEEALSKTKQIQTAFEFERNKPDKK